MEKKIILNGEEITLKAVFQTSQIYRAQFTTDIMEAYGMFSKVAESKDYSLIEYDKLARLVWAMAKTANENFTPYDEWSAGLETFPAITIMGEISDLVSANLVQVSDIKPKNARRAES